MKVTFCICPVRKTSPLTAHLNHRSPISGHRALMVFQSISFMLCPRPKTVLNQSAKMKKKTVGPGEKPTDTNTLPLFVSPSLSHSPFSQPVIQRSVVQATALATVPPRAQCCRVRMKVPGGTDANHPLHLTREPHRNPGHKPAPRVFLPAMVQHLCVLLVLGCERSLSFT